MNTNILLSASLAMILAGCAIGPDYKSPSLDIPTNFRDRNTSDTSTINTTWWQAFDDQRLNQTVQMALENNFDLISADASVESMLGKFDTAKSYLYPQINANGSLTRTGVNNATSYKLRDGVLSTYAANLSLMSYEIDLFGRVQRANEVVRAQLLATEYSRQTLMLSIIANTAATYLKIASLKSQIELAHDNIKASQDIYNLNVLKYRYGTIAQSVLLQSQAELENAKAQLSGLNGTLISEEATLNLLLGRHPSEVITSPLETIAYPKTPAYLPSEVLKKRPDIAYAEQNLIAANAKVGIAMAGYYPSFKLTGLLGVQSIELSDLTSNPTKLWELAPSISIPLFTAGRVSGEIKTAEADYNATRATYQKAVVSALNDVDNALGQNQTIEQQLNYQKERSDAMKKAFEQARMRYDVGTIAYNELLVIQLQWLAAQQNYLLAKQNSLISIVNVYKALGGGWDANQTIPIPNNLPAGR